MHPEQRPAAIEQLLRQSFSVQTMQLEDQSAAHVGHASAGGAGHFALHIVSEDFEGKRLLQRHRMVYSALSELMECEIHALSISARTPSELD